MDYCLHFSSACSIELDNKVIVTGGTFNQTRVFVYNMDGWIMELPQLITGRFGHGCGQYINTDDKMVNYFSGYSNIILSNVYIFRYT